MGSSSSGPAQSLLMALHDSKSWPQELIRNGRQTRQLCWQQGMCGSVSLNQYFAIISFWVYAVITAAAVVEIRVLGSEGASAHRHTSHGRVYL